MPPIVINKSRYAPIYLERKDANAKIAYALDWTDWLIGADTINSVAVTVNGATKLGAESIVGGKETRVTIGGGTPGTIATVLWHVISTNGLEDDRTTTLEITER